MYNIDELTKDDLTHMKRYIGVLKFIFDEGNNPSCTYLLSVMDGKTFINQISLHEIKTMFSNQLYKAVQNRDMLLDFYADKNKSGELYNIKELTVYDLYMPSY